MMETVTSWVWAICYFSTPFAVSTVEYWVVTACQNGDGTAQLESVGTVRSVRADSEAPMLLLLLLFSDQYRPYDVGDECSWQTVAVSRNILWSSVGVRRRAVSSSAHQKMAVVMRRGVRRTSMLSKTDCRQQIVYSSARGVCRLVVSARRWFMPARSACWWLFKRDRTTRVDLLSELGHPVTEFHWWRLLLSFVERIG